jgi:hypothetical protein
MQFRPDSVKNSMIPYFSLFKVKLKRGPIAFCYEAEKSVCWDKQSLFPYLTVLSSNSTVPVASDFSAEDFPPR